MNEKHSALPSLIDHGIVTLKVNDRGGEPSTQQPASSSTVKDTLPPDTKGAVAAMVPLLQEVSSDQLSPPRYLTDAAASPMPVG